MKLSQREYILIFVFVYTLFVCTLILYALGMTVDDIFQQFSYVWQSVRQIFPPFGIIYVSILALFISFSALFFTIRFYKESQRILVFEKRNIFRKGAFELNSSTKERHEREKIASEKLMFLIRLFNSVLRTGGLSDEGKGEIRCMLCRFRKLQESLSAINRDSFHMEGVREIYMKAVHMYPGPSDMYPAFRTPPVSLKKIKFSHEFIFDLERSLDSLCMKEALEKGYELRVREVEQKIELFYDIGKFYMSEKKE